MAKKVQLQTNGKEWQVIDGEQVLVDVEKQDIDPITSSSCVQIEGFRTLEEAVSDNKMLSQDLTYTKVMDKVGGDYHQNVLDGQYSKAILYGNTQVNLCEEDTSVGLQIPTTFTSFNNSELQINNKENQVVAPLIKGVTMVNLAQINSASLASSESVIIENVKGNTLYTLSFKFTTKNTNSGVTIESYNGDTYLENTMHKTGLGDDVKFTFITHANAAKVHICNNAAYGGETIQLDDIMLIEGDQTALDIPYFKGMKSVELVRPLTNLFTNDLQYSNASTTSTNNNDTVTVTASSNKSWASTQYILTNLKAHTNYLVMWDNVSATQTSTTSTNILICVVQVSNNVNLGGMDNNSLNPTKRCIMFNTGDIPLTDIALRVHATLGNTEAGTTTVTGLRIFEYDDYLRSVDLQSIGYFSGTKNVAAEPIKTCSKNLYPYGDINFTSSSAAMWCDAKGNQYMYGDIAQKSKSRFLLKKGTYKFSYNSASNTEAVAITDDKGSSMYYSDTTFTLIQDGYFSLVVKTINTNTLTTATNIQIERGETATDYVAHDSRYYEPDGQNAVVLRSLPNGVCDTFNLQTGELVQRIHSHVFDGATYELNFMNKPGEVLGDDMVGGWSSLYNMYAPKHNSFSVSCDIPTRQRTLTSDSDYVNKEFFMVGVNTFIISLSKTRLNGLSISQYLTRNPITVQYELAEPITTIIPRTIKRNNNGTVSTVDFGTYTNKESLVLPSNPSYLTINSMTSIKPVVEPITYVDFKTRLKTNTDYSIIMDKNSINKTINLGGTSKTYADKMLVRTPSVNLEQNLRISGSGSIQNIIVIEGDVLDKEIPYFNGMCNVKMPIVRNCGRNLFNTQFELGTMSSATGVLTSVTTAIRAIDYIKIIGGKQYVFYCDNPAYKFAYVCYDANKKFLRTNGAYSSGTVIRLGSDVQYVKMRTPDGNGMNDVNVKLAIYEYNESVKASFEPYRGNDICLASGEIGLSQDMFEQGGISSYPSAGTVKTYESCKQNNSTRLRSKDLFKVNGGSTYRISFLDNNKRYQYYLWDASGNSIGLTNGWSDDTTQIQTLQLPSEASYMSLMFRNINNSNIDLSSVNVERDFQLLELDSTVQLRSLPNGVKDELNLLTGEYIQRVGEVTFDGSENWSKVTWEGSNNLFDLGFGNYNAIHRIRTNLLCDKLNSEFITNTSNYGIGTWASNEGDVAVTIAIRNGKETIQDFKASLASSPITVQYELAEPIISYPRIVSNTQEREVGVKLPNDICDTYNPSTGITVKRVGKVVLDGSEDYATHEGSTGVTTFTPQMLTVWTAEPISDAKTGSVSENPRIGAVLSSGFPYFGPLVALDSRNQEMHFISETGRLNFNIALSKLPTHNILGLKTYLASNPITVWYELKNPIVTTDIVLPNGIHDEYNPLTGLYTKRVGYVEFDGSDDEIWSPQVVAGNDTHCYASISIDGTISPEMKHMANNDEVYIMSNSYETVARSNYSYDKEQMYVWSVRTVYLNIIQSRLSTVDITGFRQYLSQNPIKLWYELQNPITYQLTPYFGLPIPYAYKDGYLIMDSAYDGQTLPPEITYQLTVNRTGQITQNNIKLKEHTARLSNLEYMLIEATLDSIFDREMQNFELELMNVELFNLDE